MIDTIRTEITFPDNPLRFIVRDVTVRTPVLAKPAPGTGLLIDHDPATFTFRKGIRSAKVGADGRITLETERRKKVEMELLCYAPRPKGRHATQWRPGLEIETVFLPAGHLT
jgi:hypothetical protein